MPKATIPASTATGPRYDASAATPVAVSTTDGTSRRWYPRRSPYRPAAHRAIGASSACTRSATATSRDRPAGSAIGRKVTTTPAASVTAANTTDSRTSPVPTIPRSTRVWEPSRDAGRPAGQSGRRGQPGQRGRRGECEDGGEAELLTEVHAER